MCTVICHTRDDVLLCKAYDRVRITKRKPRWRIPWVNKFRFTSCHVMSFSAFKPCQPRKNKNKKHIQWAYLFIFYLKRFVFFFHCIRKEKIEFSLFHNKLHKSKWQLYYQGVFSHFLKRKTLRLRGKDYPRSKYLVFLRVNVRKRNRFRVVQNT